MKKLIIVLAIVLTGCATGVARVETVIVDKPIPFCPTPPVERDSLASIPYQVDKLNDKSSAGDVAQAYKYDMMLLRQLRKIDDMILEAYKNNSTNLDEVRKEVDKAYNSLSNRLNITQPAAAPSTQPSGSATPNAIEDEVDKITGAIKNKIRPLVTP